MAELLSPEWLAAVPRALAGRLPPGRPAEVTVVQVAVTSPRTPDTRWWVCCAAEEVTVGDGVATDEALVTVTVDRTDLGAVLSGGLPVDVGFMQGRLKVDGPTTSVLALLRWTAGASFEAARQALAAATDAG